MKKFDLMKEKPNLDIQTLNFIWDELWRSNHCNNRSNEKKRHEYMVKEHLMKRLEELADDKIIQSA